MTTDTLPHTLGPRIVVECAPLIGLTALENSRDGVLEAIFEAKLRLGWQSNWPSGMALVECAWRRAYSGRSELPLIKQIMCPSALDTWARAADKKWTSDRPQVGSIGVLKNGECQESAAFIVLDVMSTWLGSIETVGERVRITGRTIKYGPSATWHLIGFINPPCYE